MDKTQEEWNQHGFMKDRSCLTLTIYLYEKIRVDLDARNPINVKYLDSTNLFDTVINNSLLSN